MLTITFTFESSWFYEWISSGAGWIFVDSLSNVLKWFLYPKSINTSEDNIK